jgi:hypothetical protein
VENLNWTSTTSLLGKTFHFKFQVLDTPRVPTKGLSARIPYTVDFCVFLDYDNIRDTRLIEELQDLAELFELSDFYVMGTSEYNRHAIAINRMPMRECLQVVWASTCDYNFKRGIHINEFRTWILRCAEKGSRPKPQYLYTVESPHNGKRLQSEAHAIFLRDCYGIKVRLTHPDGNKELKISPDGQDFYTVAAVEMQNYLTASKTDANKLLKEYIKKGGEK